MTQPAAKERHGPLTGNSVLLVEDSRAIASLLTAQIEERPGLSCLHADSLQGARKILESSANEIFIAILDLNLPDAPDGEVVELVQSHGIPAVILTSSVDEQQRHEYFLKRHVADYVSKNHLSGVGIAVDLVERIRENRDSKLLVVDDSASQRAYVCSLLHNRGYQTLQAANGCEGLKLVDEDPDIRLVLTDYNMPCKDGLSMVQEIRRLRSADELGIIGISGAGEKGILARFLKSGANDFLTKPFETEELYCRIDQNLDMLRYIREAQNAANHDFLTGLYNRRYFFKQAEKLHARALQGELRLMVAAIDADHFKRVNDTYGHQAGDEALVAMAEVLRTHAGAEGFPARFGGEEFVCIQVLDENQLPGACLESLRAGIEAIQLTGPDGERIALTVSIGATNDPKESIDQMLQVADEAVYLAKEQGRNRVVLVEA